MIIVYEMQYLHPVDEKSSIQLIPFSSQYQEEYKRIYNQCYHEMRKELDIKPFDFIQDESFFESGMDKVFLLLCDGKIIGSVALKGDEIDDLIVDIKNQNQGYGKQILLWALEHINSERIILHVAEWNKKAIDLYKKNGFEIVNKIKIYNDEKFIRN
jgi:ribosomal protein S18 acetylase RimI-like enzyme